MPCFLIIALIQMVTSSVLVFLASQYFTYELYAFQAWSSLDLIQLFRNVPSKCDDGDDSFFSCHDYFYQQYETQNRYDTVR